VSRTSGGQTLSFAYDAENRLVGVSGAASAAFVYDGDGRRVKGTVNGVTSYRMIFFRFPTFSGLTQHARQSTIGDNL
jgi:YD repeat-containing protein